METIALILFVPALLVLLYFGGRDFFRELKAGRVASEKFWVILSIPVLIFLTIKVSFTEITGPGWSSESVKRFFSVGVAGLISFFWILYLTWLDLYEREKKRYLILVFVLGCIFTFLVFPVSGIVNMLGFNLNGNGWNDFLYCIFGIGTVEEIAKFIPWFIMWRFSRQLDEPFDFILYASISALGFAFIENVMYLYRSDLTAVYARALYSSVAHMFFSSIIAYGWMWWEYRGHRFNLGTFLVLLMLASLGHGFYDFWLIRYDLKLQLITLLFFLLNLHFWVMMKNNLINISGFYNPVLKLRSHLFMYRLVSLLLIVLIVSMIGYNILFGQEATRNFGWYILSQYSYVFVYVTVSFSSFQIIPGYIGSFKWPGNVISLLLPKIIYHPDYTGYQIQLDRRGRKATGSDSVLNYLAGTQKQLQHRVVIDGLPNCYGIEVNQQIYVVQFIKEHPRQENVWQVMVFKAKDATLESKSYFKSIEVSRQGEMLARILIPE